jgi:hypothetical protein
MTLAVRIALLLAAAAAAGCDSPGRPLDSQALQTSVKSLGSLAAEAQLLAHQQQIDSVTRAFTLVHQDALEQESLKLAKALARPAPDELRDRQQRAATLNLRLRAGLQQVAGPARVEQLAQLEKEFQSLHGQAKALEQRP